MRASLLTAVLALVLGASALNLALGALWIVAVLAIVWLRRRMRGAAILVLLLVVAGGIAAARAHRLDPPAPASYERDELDVVLAQLPFPRDPAPATSSPVVALQARLEAIRRDEDRYTAEDVERRAAAALALSRNLGRFRGRAPAEVAAVENAVRQLALTLTSPEFRDLDARRRRADAWLAELGSRLAVASDPAETAAIARALDPAVLATVSLRAIRDDLRRVDAATRALLHALGGRDVTVAAVSRLRYDEAGGRILAEDRYDLAAEPPLRIVRVDASELARRAAEAGETGSLAYEVAGTSLRDLVGRGDVNLEPGAGRVGLVHRRARVVRVRTVRSALKPIAFRAVVVEPGDAPPRELLVTVGLDPTGVSALLPIAIPAIRIERLVAPRYGLYHVSAPGAVAAGDGDDVRDEWTPASLEAARPGALVAEIVPDTALLRNRAFAWLGAYCYRPNAGVVLAMVALAALAVCLAGRRRVAAAAATV